MHTHLHQTYWGNYFQRRRTFLMGVQWRLCLLLFGQITVFSAHSLRSQSLTGTWVGMRYQPDSGFLCPLPLLLQVRPDSTYTLSLLDNAAAAPRATWSLSGGRLRLDTAVFSPEQVKLTAHQLTITGSTPMAFRRLKTTGLPANVPALATALTNRSWQANGVTYHFHEGGQACLENTGALTLSHRCWVITERDEAVFLVVKGNQVDCSRNYESPMQVLSLLDNRLLVSRYGVQSVDTLTLVAGSRLPPDWRCAARGFQQGFQLCSSCLYAPANQANEFDKKGPPGRFMAIRDRLQAGFKPPGNVPGNGNFLIQVRCLVNCVGQAGQFSAQSYTPDYRLIPNSPALTTQLLAILQTHFSAGWQPGRVRNVGRPLDYVATINIRLVEGRITDVFP